MGGVSVAQWLERRSANPRPWVLSPSRPTHLIFLSLIFTAIVGPGVCDSLSHSSSNGRSVKLQNFVHDEFS